MMVLKFDVEFFNRIYDEHASNSPVEISPQLIENSPSYERNTFSKSKLVTIMKQLSSIKTAEELQIMGYLPYNISRVQT